MLLKPASKRQSSKWADFTKCPCILWGFPFSFIILLLGPDELDDDDDEKPCSHQEMCYCAGSVSTSEKNLNEKSTQWKVFKNLKRKNTQNQAFSVSFNVKAFGFSIALKVWSNIDFYRDLFSLKKMFHTVLNSREMKRMMANIVWTKSRTDTQSEHRKSHHELFEGNPSSLQQQQQAAFQMHGIWPKNLEQNTHTFRIRLMPRRLCWLSCIRNKFCGIIESCKAQACAFRRLEKMSTIVALTSASCWVKKRR